MDEEPIAPTGRRSVEEMLRQAPVPPMHDDGVRPFLIGTAAFVVAALVIWLAGDSWIIQDWWLEVAVTGIGIGAVGSLYCIWRRNTRARDAAQGIAPPTA